MVPYYGDFAEDDTVDIVFNAFTSNDPSASATITNFVNTDVHIHKDLGVGQRNNAAGITVSVDYDGITGNHAIKIDTSDNTVAGFYVTGSEYQVRIEGTTVDGATINAWVGTFSIERAGGVIALLKLIQAAVITNAAGTDVAADIIAVKAETATIVADTGELQTDDIPGTLATIAGYIDTEVAAITDAVITNAAGADIAADIIAVKAETAAIVNDTDVIDDGTSGLVKIASDVAAVKAKTDNLPSNIPKGVAFPDFTFFMADSSDHVTPKTGLTVTATISKDGEAFAACTNAVAEIASGFYKIDLTATEMNADTITVKLTATGADQAGITMKTDT